LKRGQAIKKNNDNLACKVWVALLSHLNTGKEDKAYALKVKTKFDEKQRVDNAVKIIPKLDKYLPEELNHVDDRNSFGRSIIADNPFRTLNENVNSHNRQTIS